MRRAGEPVDVGLRQPVFQIAEERWREDRIPRAPEQQGGNPAELGQPAKHTIERRSAGMSRLQRDVGHEVPNRSAALRRGVWCAERGTHLRDERSLVSSAAPRTKVAVRTHTNSRSTGCGPAGSGATAGPRRERYAGVGQDDPRDPIAMALGPAERDRSAPVVRRDDDRAGDAQGLGH